MKIGIIGGGIGGTATARALLNKGFDVTIFEQAPAFGEVGAGVQITPNAVKAIMGTPLREARETFEREYLRVQIRRFSGNISRTATFIGMERSALHRKLKALGIGDTKGEPEE